MKTLLRPENMNLIKYIKKLDVSILYINNIEFDFFIDFFKKSEINIEEIYGSSDLSYLKSSDNICEDLLKNKNQIDYINLRIDNHTSVIINDLYEYNFHGDENALKNILIGLLKCDLLNFYQEIQSREYYFLISNCKIIKYFAKFEDYSQFEKDFL